MQQIRIPDRDVIGDTEMSNGKANGEEYGGMQEQIEKMEHLLECRQALKELLEADPYRPKYHFLPPGGWLNDPTGAIFWDDRYHLFYEYYPEAAYQVFEHENQRVEHLKICWGHASSRDLVHWVHHPIALKPTDPDLDIKLCASGSAVDNDGVATIIYFGIPGGMCIATAVDGGLDRWTKHPHPVVPIPKPGEPNHGKYGVIDPCMWKQGEYWYALGGGARDPDGGDAASLFKSKDTIHWEFVHQFYKSDRSWTTATEDCACPDFFPIGDKHMLLFMSHDTGVQYYLGKLKNESFFPENHGRMNWPGGQLNAPKTMIDKQGRRLMWAWACEARTRDTQRAAGWAGVLSLPRVLDLDADGDLLIEPAPELEILRHNRREKNDIVLKPDADCTLPDFGGDCLELAISFDPGTAEEIGIRVRRSPDGVEQTSVSFDLTAGKMIIDTSKSSLRDDILQPWPRTWSTLFKDPSIYLDEMQHVQIQEAPFRLGAGEHLELRVFLDRSILEAFANRRQCMTQRIYPSMPDSLDMAVFARGGEARVLSIVAWDMDSIGL